MPSEHWPPTCSPPRSARRVAPSRSRLRSKTHPARCRSDVVDALQRWRELRDESPELAHNPFLFPRLGRRRRDGLPDADGQLSITALMRTVRPIMPAADVPVEQAHPHALRGTFGPLCMATPKAELSTRQRTMGHPSPETTSRYVHHDDHELAAEPRRIERLQRRPARPRRRASAGATRRHGGTRSGRSSRDREAGRATLHRRRQGRNQAHLALSLGSCPQGQVSWRKPC
jgi:hypothetical protein